MTDPIYLASGLAIVVVITFGLRATGFLARGVLRSTPVTGMLERWMPLGVVAILAVYCIGGFDFGSAAAAIPEIAGSVVTVALHVWKRNMLVSIGGGAMTCIVLANWIVPL